MRYQTCFAFLAAALVGTAVNAAQAAVSEADRQFIEQAAMAGHEEVTSGKTAAESKNPAIAQFGRQMVEEHVQMNQELATLAKQKGVEPPESASLADQAKGAATSVLPGATFDKTYVSQQLADHQETLQLMQKQASSGDDPDLKTLAQKAIPIIQKHLTELEALQKLPELQ